MSRIPINLSPPAVTPVNPATALARSAEASAMLDANAMSVARRTATGMEGQSLEQYQTAQYEELESKNPYKDLPYEKLPLVRHLIDTLGPHKIGYYRSFVGKMATSYGGHLMSSYAQYKADMNAGVPGDANPLFMFLPNDAAWDIPLNYDDADKSDLDFNNKEALDREMDAAGVRYEHRLELIGWGDDTPISYGQFQHRLASYMINDERMSETATWTGATVGFGVDLLGLHTLNAAVTAPAIGVIGRVGLSAEATAGIEAGTFVLSRSRSAVSFAVAGAVETGLIQSVREGINPHSNPEVGDIVFELMMAGGFGTAFGSVLGGRGFKDLVRTALQSQPQYLRTAISPRGTVYALPTNMPFGYWVSDQIDETVLLGSWASVADNLDGVTDEIFTETAKGVRDESMIGRLLWDARESGVVIDQNLARKMSRSIVKHYQDGKRGLELRDAVINGVESELAPTTELAAFSTWRYADDTAAEMWQNLVVNSPSLPGRGHHQGYIDIATGPVSKMRAAAQSSPTVAIAREAAKRKGSQLTPEEAQRIVSELYEDAKNGLKWSVSASRILRSFEGMIRKSSPRWNKNIRRRGEITAANIRRQLSEQSSAPGVTNTMSVPGTAMSAPQSPGGGNQPGGVPPSQPGPVPPSQPGAAPVPPAQPGAVPPAQPGAVPPAQPGATPPPVPGTVQFAPPIDQRTAWESLHHTIPWLSSLTGGIVPMQTGLNQPAAVFNHGNPMARIFGMFGFSRRVVQDVVTNESVAQPYSVFEHGTHEMNGRFVDFGGRYRRRLVQFIVPGADANTNVNQAWRAVAGLNNLTTLRFNRSNEMNLAALRLIRSNTVDPTSTEPVHALARDMQEMLADMYGAANQAGVRGFGHVADPSYVPRLNNWETFRELAQTVDGREALYQFYRRALNTAVDPVTGLPARRVIWDNGTETLYTDIDDAARSLTDAMIRRATDSRASPFLEADQDLVDSLGNILGPLAGGLGDAPVNRAKGRVFLDETVVMPLPPNVRINGAAELSMENLASTDVPYMMRQYFQTIQGAINEERAVAMANDYFAANGIMGANGVVLRVETLRELAAVGKRIATEYGFEDINDTTMQNIDTIIGALRYRATYQHVQSPMASNNWRASQVFSWFVNGLAEEGAGLLHHGTFLTFGGKFGMNQTGELGRTMGVFGVYNTLRRIPLVMEQMAQGWWNMSDEGRYMLGTLDRLSHPNVDKRVRNLYMMNMGAPGSWRFGNTTEIVGGWASDRFANVTGLHYTQAFQQMLTNMTALDYLIAVGRGQRRRLDDAMLRVLGIEPAQHDAMAQWVANNVITQRRLLQDVPVDFRNYNDPEYFQMLGFLDRASRTQIQDIATPMDLGQWAFTPFGRLMTEMRKYNIKALDNFIGSGATQLRSLEVAAMRRLITTITYVGTISALVKHAYHHWERWNAAENGDWAEVKRLDEEELTFEGMVKNGAGMVAEVAPIQMFGDAYYKAMGQNKNFFGTSQYHVLDPRGTAKVQLAMRWFENLSIPMDPEKEMTVERAQKLYNSMPFIGSFPFAETLLEDSFLNKLRRMNYPEFDPNPKSQGWIDRELKKVPF
jgi:hypothetical protein